MHYLHHWPHCQSLCDEGMNAFCQKEEGNRGGKKYEVKEKAFLVYIHFCSLSVDLCATNGSRSENNLWILSSYADEVVRKSVMLSNVCCKELVR